MGNPLTMAGMFVLFVSHQWLGVTHPDARKSDSDETKGPRNQGTPKPRDPGDDARFES